MNYVLLIILDVWAVTKLTLNRPKYVFTINTFYNHTWFKCSECWCLTTYCLLHHLWHPAPGAANTGRASFLSAAPPHNLAAAETSQRLPASERGLVTLSVRRTMRRRRTGTAACWWGVAQQQWTLAPHTPARPTARWLPTQTGHYPWASLVWWRAPLGHWPVYDKPGEHRSAFARAGTSPNKSMLTYKFKRAGTLHYRDTAKSKSRAC